MSHELSNLERREGDLTVVRGALGTVLSHWDDLDQASARELLTVALERVEDLVHILEEDCSPLRARSVPA